MGFGRSLYFSGLTSVSKLIIQFGLSVYVARMLTPEELGSFGVALAAAALLRAFESAGINNFVASYKELDAPLLRTVFTANSLLNVILALIIWLLAEPAGAFYESDAIARILELTAIATLLNTHIPIMQGLLRREMQFKPLMGLDLGLMIVTGVATVAGILLGYGPLALALAIVAERLAGLLVGITVFARTISMVPRLQGMRTVLDYGLSLSTATVIGMIGAHSNNFILGKILGLASAAQFDRGYTLPRLVSNVAHMSFHNVLVPEVARQTKAGNPCSPILQEVIQLYTMILWPAGAVLVITAPEIVLTLFGPQWQLAAGIAPYFVLFGLVSSPIAMACSAMVALGHGKALIRNQLTEQLSKVAVFMTAFYFDLHILAMLLAIPTALYAVVALSQLKSLGLISPGEFCAALVRPLRMTALCALPAALMHYVFTVDGYLSLAALVSVGAISLIGYFLGMFLLERPTLEKALVTVGLKQPI